jgi:hypothetical protein
LSSGVSDDALTQALIDQLVGRSLPDIRASGLPPLLLLFLDPVSLSLADPQGQRISYNLQTNAVSNPVSDAFVSVAGNVEVLVMPMSEGSATLNISDVPSTARGGVAVIGSDTEQSYALTDSIRGGQDQFIFTLPATGTPQNQATILASAGSTESSSATDSGQPSASSSTTGAPVGAAGQTAVASATAEETVNLFGYLTDDKDLTPAQLAQKKAKHQDGTNAAPGDRKEPASRPAFVPASQPSARSDEPQGKRVVAVASRAAVKSVKAVQATKHRKRRASPQSSVTVPTASRGRRVQRLATQSHRNATMIAGLFLAAAALYAINGRPATARRSTSPSERD